MTVNIPFPHNLGELLDLVGKGYDQVHDLPWWTWLIVGVVIAAIIIRRGTYRARMK